jgi:hypothetical protein
VVPCGLATLRAGLLLAGAGWTELEEGNPAVRLSGPAGDLGPVTLNESGLQSSDGTAAILLFSLEK